MTRRVNDDLDWASSWHWRAKLKDARDRAAEKDRPQSKPVIINLRYCVFETTPWGCCTRFPDGTESSNWPPGDDYDAFTRLAASCGSAPLTYVREHDFCHSLLAEHMLDRPSCVLWAAAHGTPAIESGWEEKMVFYFQRFVHGIARAPDLEWRAWRQQVPRFSNV